MVLPCQSIIIGTGILQNQGVILLEDLDHVQPASPLNQHHLLFPDKAAYHTSPEYNGDGIDEKAETRQTPVRVHMVEPTDGSCPRPIRIPSHWQACVI